MTQEPPMWTWIPVTERLPQAVDATETFYGGKASYPCLCLFPDDAYSRPGCNARVCYYIHYDNGGQWADIEANGSVEYCASHGDPEPTHWMPWRAP